MHAIAMRWQNVNLQTAVACFKLLCCERQGSSTSSRSQSAYLFAVPATNSIVAGARLLCFVFSKGIRKSLPTDSRLLLTHSTSPVGPGAATHLFTYSS